MVLYSYKCKIGNFEMQRTAELLAYKNLLCVRLELLQFKNPRSS